MKQVHYVESYSGQSMFKMTINMDIGRELTEEDKRVIWKAADEIQKEITARTTLINPDNIKIRDAWLAKAKELFHAAGQEAIYIQQIPNEYCGPKCCPHLPWLNVTTEFGIVKVGWRKRVINLDWSASDLTAEADELFPNEQTTKGGRMIHCWGYEKLGEYLKKLSETFRCT